jgi:hypothetical protein
LAAATAAFTHLATAFQRHAGGGRFFQHLLMAALHRAVALEQVNAVALRVGKDLDFDVARLGDVFFDQHMLVAEAGNRLAFAEASASGKSSLLSTRRMPLPPPPAAGLDQYRVADLVGFTVQQGGRLVVAVVARGERHSGLAHQLLGFGFRTHGANRRGRRADEGDAAGGAGFGEIGVLGEEAVAGMDRLGAGAPGGVEDFVGDQIGFAGSGRAEQHGFVGEADMAGVGIGLGIDGDRADAHAAGGLDHPAGDFAAVGDKDLVEHGLFPNPVGLTFVEEGGDAFAGFRRGTQVGDAMGGVFDQRVVDRLVIDGADQVLGGGLGERAALKQAATISCTLASSSSGATASWTRPISRARLASIRSADWK